MTAARRGGAMGKTRSRQAGFWCLAVVLLAGLLSQACSDNKGPAGPTFGSGQTGTADTAADIRVQVAVNPNTIRLGQRAGITVLATNTNGRPLQGRHVQVSTTVGRLDRVDGFTDAAGKFVTFLTITDADARNAAGLTEAEVTAFVEGAVGTADVNFGVPPPATPTTPPTNGNGAVATVVTIMAPDAAAAEASPQPDTGTLVVERTGSTTAALTVNFTVLGTAMQGTDYTLNVSGVVMIPAGSSAANIIVTPIDDTMPEPEETVQVSVTAGAGYTVGSPSAATVRIAAND
jgi:Calx-beta domain